MTASPDLATSNRPELESAPDISVVMPSYNHQDYVEETVRSVLESPLDDSQTLEMVVVDDGSTDATYERLLAIDDPRLRLSRQHNAGAHVAFNRGLEQARGEIIFLLNSDDIFEPQRISTLARHLEDHPELLAVGSWLRLIDAQGQEIGLKKAWRNLPPWPRPMPGPGLSDLEDPALALLETNHLATTSNIAFRRRALDQGLRFRDLRYCHDWDFFLGLCQRGRLDVIERPLARYRVHADNTLKEGADTGQARMRFEILWLIAAHAHQIARRAHRALPHLDPEELRQRAVRSLPRFSGRDELLWQLIARRGDRAEMPTRFLALLDRQHPWRRHAEQQLREGAR